MSYDPERVTAYSPKGVGGYRAFSIPKRSQPVFKSYFKYEALSDNSVAIIVDGRLMSIIRRCFPGHY
jgi:hypothetical protein